MKSINYYVCSCLECNKLVLIKIDFMDFNKECCLDFKNLKILKIFNDENEAKNYMKIYRKNEE
jgi:hypothetical protein